MPSISSMYRDKVMQVISKIKLDVVITEHNVKQDAQGELMPLFDTMLRDHILPGSTIAGIENLELLMDKAKAGSACLLLLEHYSNFDLPAFSYLVRMCSPRGKEIADSIVAIAGMKLNEDNPMVSALVTAFSRIVIYPSRSLQDLDATTARAELIRANSINRAAMKALIDVKYDGKLVLVFPAGTRYRPWDPETKKGVREIDSYIKSFDYMCLVSINGAVLKIQKGDMTEDLLEEDIIRMEVSPPIPCTEFREKVKEETADDVDKKQAVVDAVMARLEQMHDKNEKIRLQA